MNQSKKQLGLALPITILIVVVLIVVGGAGYYFYKTSVEKAEVPLSETTPPLEEIERKIKEPLLAEEVCEKTTNKDGCYDYVAQETKDASLCEKITDRVSKNVCYIAVAQKTKDSSLCEEAPNKDMCYYNLALDAKNSSLCEKIIDSGLKYSCITGVTERK